MAPRKLGQYDAAGAAQQAFEPVVSGTCDSEGAFATG